MALFGRHEAAGERRRRIDPQLGGPLDTSPRPSVHMSDTPRGADEGFLNCPDDTVGHRVTAKGDRKRSFDRALAVRLRKTPVRYLPHRAKECSKCGMPSGVWG
ncbi:hypothetical protein GCM10010405_46820 [Streptomyces macrosporus]|uniref:Transposase n=1 Tax=Streptomyces macrosporus TaxID=44032 RepID=A0ABN3KHA5_9ACTN